MNREIFFFFLAFVREYVAEDPECAPMVTEFVRQGVSNALAEANLRAADMETALTVAMARRYKGADELIRDKLAAWEGKTSMNWSKFLHNTA